MRRVTMAAALAVVLAMVAAGCGNKADTSGGGGGGGRQLAAAGPADHGAGRSGRRVGHDRARDVPGDDRTSKVVDKGIEVYNVPGRGRDDRALPARLQAARASPTS